MGSKLALPYTYYVRSSTYPAALRGENSQIVGAELQRGGARAARRGFELNNITSAVHPSDVFSRQPLTQWLNWTHTE